jgi:hypothetical protein
MTMVALLAAGCPSNDPVGDAVSELCHRADECNFLDGASVEECIENRTACVEQLTETQQEDWVAMMDECFELQSCQLFGECWLYEVYWC